MHVGLHDWRLASAQLIITFRKISCCPQGVYGHLNWLNW